MNRLSTLHQLAMKTAHRVHEVDEGADEMGSHESGINGPRQVFRPGPRPMPWTKTPRLQAVRPADVERSYEPHQIPDHRNMSSRQQRLVQLAAKTSERIEFDYGPDGGPDERRRQGSLLGGAAKVGGTLGAVGAAGVYGRGRLIQAGTIGPRQPGVMNTMRAGISKVSPEQALPMAENAVAGTKAAVGGLMGRIRKGVAGFAKSELSSRQDKLIQLHALTDQAILNFEETDEHRHYDYVKKGAAALGIAGAGLGIGMAGHDLGKEGYRRGKAGAEAFQRGYERHMKSPVREGVLPSLREIKIGGIKRGLRGAVKAAVHA